MSNDSNHAVLVHRAFCRTNVLGTTAIHADIHAPYK